MADKTCPDSDTSRTDRTLGNVGERKEDRTDKGWDEEVVSRDSPGRNLGARRIAGNASRTLATILGLSGIREDISHPRRIEVTCTVILTADGSPNRVKRGTSPTGGASARKLTSGFSRCGSVRVASLFCVSNGNDLRLETTKYGKAEIH